MQPSYWESHWRKGLIGFHSETPNPRLIHFWSEISFPENCPVLVPLCGKTPDMIWLRDHGHSVVGIELSEIACNSFFNENNLAFKKEKKGRFTRYIGDRITLWQGNFFHFVPSDIKPVRAVYDRAALVALPPEMRLKYVQKLRECLDKDCNIFLHTFEYDPDEMNGPPFTVFEEEVRNLFHNFEYRCLLRENMLAALPKFRHRGLSTLVEKAILLKHREA